MHETGWISCRQLARKDVFVFVNVFGDASCEIIHQEKLPVAVRRAINNDTVSLVRKTFPTSTLPKEYQMINFDTNECGSSTDEISKREPIVISSSLQEPLDEPRRLLPKKPR